MSDRPHILLITTDQQRFDSLGYNHNRVLETPNLDAIAAGGVNFTRAYATCPVCIPARRTLLSGQHPATHGLRHYEDGLDWDPPFTLPGLLGQAGYQTQLVGKLHMHPQRKRYGFDHMVLSDSANLRPTSRYAAHNDYTDWLRSRGIDTHPQLNGISGNGRLARPYHLDEPFHHNAWLVQAAAEFLTKRRDPSCPWFLHLSFTAPHPPLTPPAVYYERYRGKEMPAPVLGEWVPRAEEAPRGLPPDSGFGPFDPEIIRNAWAGYYGLINHIDDCVAFLLEQYREYGNPRQGEPIWVLFTSDHGEMLGDHHLFRKSLPFEASAHVPFFLGGYNVEKSAGECDALACLEDVPPTLLDLAGVDIPEGMDGHSLAPAIRGEQAPRREVLFGECGGGANNHHYVVHGDHKYIWWLASNEEQLFDLKDDPGECRDLSGDAARLAPMRALLAEHMAGRDHAAYDPAQLRPLDNRPPSAFPYRV
ncbi:MAG: sulfatase-like hydrolase/transferase [Verrucomicrobiota bacterium]